MIGSSTSNSNNVNKNIQLQEIARLSQKLAETMDLLCQYQNKHSQLTMQLNRLQDRMKQVETENDRLAKTVTIQAQHINQLEGDFKQVETDLEFKTRECFEMRRELISGRERISDLERLLRLRSGK